jgi:hypothetical protein
MPKTNKDNGNIVAKAQEENPNTQMDTTITTTPEAVYQLPVEGKAVLTSNEKQTSYRLTWMAKDRPWNPVADLSLLDLKQASAGLEAIGNYVGGTVMGSRTFLLVAPVEKFGYDFGTGVMAHVSHEHKPEDAIEVILGGNTLVLHVDPRDIPSEGWQRLRLNMGELYADRETDPISTVRGQMGGWLNTSKSESAAKARTNNWPYWYCQSLSAIMAGRNVSVSVGPLSLDKAKQIAAVADAPDPKAANEQRKFLNRQNNRDAKQATENTEVIRATSDGGKTLVVTDESFLVPTLDGGSISLKDWPKGKPIRWVDAQGLGGRPRAMKVGDTTERLGIVQMIITNGYRVDVS